MSDSTAASSKGNKSTGVKRVGINGFGRIGRAVFRLLSEREDLQVVAINDLYENDQLAYLLRFDTVQGRFGKEVVVGDDELVVDGERVAMTAERDPKKIPWRELGVDFVVESTGVFRHREKCAWHLEAGAQRVVLTVPPKDAIDAMIVKGVNDQDLLPEHQIVSNASCTTNCLAPLAKVLDDAFGIEQGLITTVHAYTNDQRLADVPHKNLRRSRAAAENIIPTTTGAAVAVGKVMPHLAGKLDGMAIRVPVPDGSIVDLVVELRDAVDVAGINGAVRRAAQGDLRDVLEYSEDPLVSSDIIGNPHSSIFDALSTTVLHERWVRVLSWYDNEWGYSNRVVDLLAMLAEFDAP